MIANPAAPYGLTHLAWAIALRTHSPCVGYRLADSLALRGLSPYGLTRLDSTPSHALKGQKLLAQGIALGNDGSKPVAL